MKNSEKRVAVSLYNLCSPLVLQSPCGRTAICWHELCCWQWLYKKVSQLQSLLWQTPTWGLPARILHVTQHGCGSNRALFETHLSHLYIVVKSVWTDIVNNPMTARFAVLTCPLLMKRITTTMKGDVHPRTPFLGCGHNDGSCYPPR